MISSTARVVVTGLGAVTAWGWGVDRLWQGLCSGRSAIASFSRFDSSDYPTQIAAEVPQEPSGAGQGLRHWSRLTQADRYGVHATAEALKQAQLPTTLSDCEASVLFASSTGGMFESEQWYSALAGKPIGRSAIQQLTGQQVSSPGDAVARAFDVRGCVQTVSTACSSGSLAIGLSIEMLRSAQADIVIAGGSDSLCRVTYGGFNALQAVDPSPCRPFRSERAGLSLGEGSGVLVLETLDHATARDATPIAELVGSGVSADAYHMTAPHPQGAGAIQALENALSEARRSPEDLDFINAHGTGTKLNDVAEFAALQSLLGRSLQRTPVTSTKASIGHLLGSAGAVEAVATVLCLQHQFIHPTPGHGEIDPAAPVRLVGGSGLSGEPLRFAASLNLGFGGTNGALLFESAH